MYNNNPYSNPGYGQPPQQWQQQQPPPPPGGMAPPPPPPPAGMSTEEAAQFRNYGYGSVPQRGPAGRGQGQGPAQGQPGAAPRPNQGPRPGQPGFPPPGQHANQPFSPAIPQQQHHLPPNPHPAPSVQGGGPPNKRPRFDSGSHNAGLPQNPQYHQQQQYPAQQVPMQMQGQQPMQYAYSQQHQQPPLPPGPAPPMQQHQPYYPQPQQVAYPMQQPYTPTHAPLPPQQQPPQGYYPPQHPQHMPLQQPLQAQHQPYPPPHGYQQPANVMHNPQLPPQPPPLAVAPMKSGPMGGNFRKGNNNKSHGLPPTPGLPPPPPPPANEPPPPPPPHYAGPPGVSRPQGAGSGSIRLDPNGAATLPPTPTGAATFAAVPMAASLPSGPSGSGPSIRRDMRPLPSQSTTAAAARHPLPPNQNQQHSDHRPSGPGAVRGGRGGGSFPARGGRGGGPSGRGGLGNDRRALGRSGGVPFDARSNASSSGSGNKRTFSQTSAGNGPPPNPKFARQRADPNATVTSQSMGRGGGYANKRLNNGKYGPSLGQQRGGPGASFSSSPARGSGYDHRAGSVLSNDARNSKGNVQKNTLTDFRIESLEIVELDWAWKATPLSEILERLDLKDRQDREKKERESTIGEETELGVKQEEDQEGEEGLPATEEQDILKLIEGSAQTDDVAPAELQAGEERKADNVLGVNPAAVSADLDSSSMQRKDSRREKRKHSADDEEDDQDIGNQLDGVAISNEAPVGKKVKSEGTAEFAEEVAEKDPSSEATEKKDPDVTVSTQEAAAAAFEPNDCLESTGEASETTIVITTSEGDTSKDDDAESVTSEDTAADAEIAASVIARPSEGETRSGSRTPGPAASEDGFATQKDHITLPPSTQASQSTHLPSKASISKKYRENSRLRIYFSSPADNQFASAPVAGPNAAKNKKKREKQRGQKRRAKLDPDALRAQRAMSVESRMTEGTSYTEVQERAEAEEEEEEEEDLDGEPLEPEVVEEEELAVKEEDAAQENGDDEPGNSIESLQQPAIPDAEPRAIGSAADAADATAAARGEDGDSADVQASAQPDQDVHAVKEEIQEQNMAEEEPLIEAKEQDIKAPEPSADRISISYARNTRRLVLNASAIEEMTVYRAEGKIEIKVRLESVPSGGKEEKLRYFSGVFVETAKDTSNDFIEVARNALREAWPDKADGTNPEDQTEESQKQMDELLPPLHRLLEQDTQYEREGTMNAEQDEGVRPSKAFKHETITVVARLDRANPLTEAKWVRTGKTDEWIVSISGAVGATTAPPSHDASGTSVNPKGESSTQVVSAWKGKIRVVDPDAPPPPPTFQHVLENWLSTANTRNGFDEARYRFVSTYFKDVNNVLEVLLRLIRGIPSSSSSQSSQYHHSTNNSQNNNTPAFQAALSASSPPYPEQQTPISLASFQLFKLGIEAAVEAGMAQEAIDKKIGEVVRSLPYFLIAKSLDSLFLDFKRTVVKGEKREQPEIPTGPAGLANARQAQKRQKK